MRSMAELSSSVRPSNRSRTSSGRRNISRNSNSVNINCNSSRGNTSLSRSSSRHGNTSRNPSSSLLRVVEHRASRPLNAEKETPPAPTLPAASTSPSG